MMSVIEALIIQLGIDGTPLRARVAAADIASPNVPAGVTLTAAAGWSGVTIRRAGGRARRRRTPLDTDLLAIRVWNRTAEGAETTYRALVDTLGYLLNERVDLGGGASAILYLAREVAGGVALTDPDTDHPLIQATWEVGYWRNAIS